MGAVGPHHALHHRENYGALLGWDTVPGAVDAPRDRPAKGD